MAHDTANRQPACVPSPTPTIAIIGLGPRGSSLVERLGALLLANPAEAPLTLHLIDDTQPGAGRVWRTDQHSELCMNTLAHAVTMFTEPGGSITGPIVEGPTLYEWCVLAHAAADGSAEAVAAIPESHAAEFAAHPAHPRVAAEYREELETLRPESHPSRALYGEYLSWFIERAISKLPSSVNVVLHRARAVSVERAAGRELISLDSGKRLEADSVVLATGWLPRSPDAAERDLETALNDRPELHWVREGSPADQRLENIPPGAHAIARGLGMGFFDVMALLTIGRGGRFVQDEAAPGGLRYLASGDEPVLHVTSRRGVPFRSKSLYHSLPPLAVQQLLREVESTAEWASAPRPIDFDRLLWPRIVGDAFLAHAHALRQVRPKALGPDPDATLAAIEAAVRSTIAPITAGAVDANLGTAPTLVAAAVAQFITDPADRFDLLGEMYPVARDFGSPAEFDGWIAERVATDLAEADLGLNSPLKAGLWSISSARGIAGKLGTLGGFDAESRGNGFALLYAVGGMAGSGPPAFRNRQLLALAQAGLVRFIGPDAPVRLEERGFVSASPRVAGSEVIATVLIDAFMHSHDVMHSADHLTRALVAQGRARPFKVASRLRSEGVPARSTGSFDIDPSTGLLLGPDGAPDSAVHVAGIPVDEALHGTIISPLPGTDPPMLRETDRVAQSALRIAHARVD